MSGDKPETPFDQIVAALGGTGAAAKQLGRRPSQICQWRTQYGKFPAELFFTIKRALKKRNLPCPRKAFRFDDKRAAG